MPDSPRLTSTQEQTLTRVRRLAWLLDHAITIPGTRIRFGLDGIIGMLPGVGDAASLLLGSLIVWWSYRFDLPLRARLTMVWHLLLDGLLGLVPLVGDLLDLQYKANHRNVTLLLEQLEREPLPPTVWQRVLGAMIPLALVMMALGLLLLPVWLLFSLF
ncbi:MAG: DUF4112 domain-containing protein [Pseudomonadota bacterium]